MKKSKMPPMMDLTSYVEDIKGAAIKFQVTEKTIVRWMQHYGLYSPTPNYGTKLNMEKARQIRNLYQLGKTVNDLSVQFQVTPSAIGRVIHNITYREAKEIADVSVIYNHIAEGSTCGG